MPVPVRLPPLAVLMLPALLLGGCFERTVARVEHTPRPVAVVSVALTADAETRDYSGIIAPRRAPALGFRAGGRIAERLVDVGARVKAGDVLARLDPKDLALAVRSAAADLAAARAQAAQALADARRSAELRRDGWTAAAADEAKQAAARTAAERVTAATAALALAERRLSDGELRAPQDGVITAVLRDRGSVVAEGEAVFELAEAGPPEIVVSLPEQALADADRPDTTVTLWARPGFVLAARLRELAPSADPRLRTYAARYVLADAPAFVAYGMSATLHLAVRGADRIALLPAAALIDRGDGPSVWTVKPDGTLAAQAVTLRRFEQDRVAVSGLADGAMVVALGAQKLDPGARVRITDTLPAAE